MQDHSQKRIFRLVFYLDRDQFLGDLFPSSLKELPDLGRPRSVPPIHLTKWARIALTHLIFPEFSNSINCLGWYCGNTGHAMWLASKRPKSDMISASWWMSSTTPEKSFYESNSIQKIIIIIIIIIILMAKLIWPTMWRVGV